MGKNTEYKPGNRRRIGKAVKSQILRWYRHVFRKEWYSIERKKLEWKPEEHHQRGRLKIKWED